MEKTMKVKVNNITEGNAKFVVARLVDGELWYWGRWDNKQEAKRVAKEIDGLVVVDE